MQQSGCSDTNQLVCKKEIENFLFQKNNNLPEGGTSLKLNVKHARLQIHAG